MQAGTQATDRFYGEIGWIPHGQQLALLVAFHTFNGLNVITRFLPFRQRNTGIHADTMLFQRLRAFNTAIKQRTQQYAHHGKHQTENDTAENNQRRFRLQHARLGNRGIDNAHIANRTGLGNLQFLLLVQQLHIDLLTGLHITRQTNNFLLRFRHRRYAPVQLTFLIFQRLAFFQQRAVRRMRFGEQLGNLRFFKGQFIQLRIDIHHRIQHRFGFQRQIHGVFILTKGVQLVFSNVQPITHLRQLLCQKRQTFGGLFGFTFHVLLQIVAGNTVEDLADLLAVFTGKGQAQYAGVFACFRHHQIILQGVYHAQRGEFADGKLALRAGMNRLNQHRHAIVFQHLADLPPNAKTPVTHQLIAFVIQHIEREGLFIHCLWQREGGHINRFVLTPHQPVPARAKNRECIFGNGDIEVKIVYRFP